MTLKRIAAMTAALLLIGMYIATLVFALTGSPLSSKLFIASVICTFVVPIIIHLFLMINNAREGRGVMDETYSHQKKDNYTH